MFSVHNEGSLEGHTNMARDRALLEAAEAGQAGARVYRWSGPWISLGRYQNPLSDLIATNAVPWVMRPTGGKAVLHGHDETVGLAMPLDLLRLSERSVKGAYRAVIRPLVEALNACGLTCVLAEDLGVELAQRSNADCFASVSPNDVVEPETLAKVCGCALRLTQKAVLVQASIPNGPPLVNPSEVFREPHVATNREWNGKGLANALQQALANFEVVEA